MEGFLGEGVFCVLEGVKEVHFLMGSGVLFDLVNVNKHQNEIFGSYRLFLRQGCRDSLVYIILRNLHLLGGNRTSSFVRSISNYEALQSWMAFRSYIT